MTFALLARSSASASVLLAIFESLESRKNVKILVIRAKLREREVERDIEDLKLDENGKLEIS